jgi:hypothetical protein
VSVERAGQSLSEIATCREPCSLLSKRREKTTSPRPVHQGDNKSAGCAAVSAVCSHQLSPRASVLLSLEEYHIPQRGSFHRITARTVLALPTLVCRRRIPLGPTSQAKPGLNEWAAMRQAYDLRVAARPVHWGESPLRSGPIRNGVASALSRGCFQRILGNSCAAAPVGRLQVIASAQSSLGTGTAGARGLTLAPRNQDNVARL